MICESHLTIGKAAAFMHRQPPFCPSNIVCISLQLALALTDAIDMVSLASCIEETDCLPFVKSDGRYGEISRYKVLQTLHSRHARTMQIQSVATNLRWLTVVMVSDPIPRILSGTKVVSFGHRVSGVFQNEFRFCCYRRHYCFVDVYVRP